MRPPATSSIPISPPPNVAEVGRQPWAIEGLLPVAIARTNLTTGTVQTTFVMFLVLLALLLIAEIAIMIKQVNIGWAHLFKCVVYFFLSLCFPYSEKTVGGNL